MTGVPNPATDQVACNGSNINPVSLALLNAKLPNGTYVIPSPQVILPFGSGFSYYSIAAPFHEEQVSFNLQPRLLALGKKHSVREIFLCLRPQYQ